MLERGSRLPLTLETAAAKLDGLAAGVVRRNLFDPQRTKSAIGERRERVDPVRDRLGRLYSFFASTEGVRPANGDEARGRYETMLDLLVHPQFDSAMTEVGDALQLPNGTAISLLGSGGNGTAQIRTLAAADVALDASPYQAKEAPHIGPDVDMMLLSRDPFPLTRSVRKGYWQKAKDILRSRGLKDCYYFNVKRLRYSERQIWERLTTRNMLETLPDSDWDLNDYADGVNAIFYPLYPKEQGNQMRKEMVGRLAQLSETDPDKYDEARARILRFMRRSYRLSTKHFGYFAEHRYENLDFFDNEGMHAVQNYFADRMTAVLTDMLDMAQQPKG